MATEYNKNNEGMLEVVVTPTVNPVVTTYSLNQLNSRRAELVNDIEHFQGKLSDAQSEFQQVELLISKALQLGVS